MLEGQFILPHVMFWTRIWCFPVQCNWSSGHPCNHFIIFILSQHSDGILQIRGKTGEHSGKTRETEASLQDLSAALESDWNTRSSLGFNHYLLNFEATCNRVSTPENRPFVFWALTKVDKRYLGKTAFPQTIVFPGSLPVWTEQLWIPPPQTGCENKEKGVYLSKMQYPHLVIQMLYIKTPCLIWRKCLAEGQTDLEIFALTYLSCVYLHHGTGSCGSGVARPPLSWRERGWWGWTVSWDGPRAPQKPFLLLLQPQTGSWRGSWREGLGKVFVVSDELCEICLLGQPVRHLYSRGGALGAFCQPLVVAWGSPWSPSAWLSALLLVCSEPLRWLDRCPVWPQLLWFLLALLVHVSAHRGKWRKWSLTPGKLLVL